MHDSVTKKKKKLSTWIKEDANSIIDFTDSSAAQKVTGTLNFFQREISCTHLPSQCEVCNQGKHTKYINELILN